MSKISNSAATLYDQAAVSGAVDSAVYSLANEDAAAFAVSWSNGSSPVGDLAVMVSIDGVIWDSLDLSDTPAITGASGQHIIGLNDVPFNRAKIRWYRSSGSCDLLIKAVSKRIT